MASKKTKAALLAVATFGLFLWIFRNQGGGRRLMQGAGNSEDGSGLIYKIDVPGFAGWPTIDSSKALKAGISWYEPIDNGPAPVPKSGGCCGG